MSWIESVSNITGIVGGLIGGLGGGLGIWTWRINHKINRYKLEEIESALAHQEEDDILFGHLLKEARGLSTAVWEAEVGSERFKTLERLADRGKLVRHTWGYMLS